MLYVVTIQQEKERFTYRCRLGCSRSGCLKSKQLMSIQIDQVVERDSNILLPLGEKLSVEPKGYKQLVSTFINVNVYHCH